MRAGALALVVLAAQAGALPGLLCAPLGFGCEAWVVRYNGPGNGLDDAGALAMSPDGATVYVTGHSLGAGTSFDIAVQALAAADGQPRWVARADGPASGVDEGRAIAVTPDGATVVTVAYGEADGAEDLIALAHDAATGAQLWMKNYGLLPGRLDLGFALALSPDGQRAFAGGVSQTEAGDWDAALLALDVATGALRWSIQTGGPGQQSLLALAVTPDGSTVIAAGLDSLAPHARVTTTAYDAATGVLRWTAGDGPVDPDDQGPVLLVLSADGATAFVAGPADGPDHTLDIAVAARDTATGALRWSARHAEPESLDRPTAIARAPDGAMLVAGFAEPKGDPGRADYLTLAFDPATGAERWAARYDGLFSRTDRALAIVADGDRVFVAGESFGTPADVHVNPANVGLGTGLDYGTVAYDLASGAELGSFHYDGANSVDRARAIGVGAGRVIVTGHSHGGESGFDYATVAYDLAQFAPASR